MALSTLLYAYVLGGITFVPLLLAAILVPAWLLLPYAYPGNSGSRRASVVKAGAQNQHEEKNEGEEEVDVNGESAASATFAVLRVYNFQAATAALNSRVVGQNTVRDTISDGNAETSESVYQSMYRSVFDRNKNVANPILDRDETHIDAVHNAKRKPVSVSVFCIVLRHGHLMLYDSAAQVEVRHVISLARYDVSLSEGDPTEILIDGDLFIKRTAIVLSPKSLPATKIMQPTTKPFYLFSTTCSEKEDFYHALLASRSPPPIPQPIASADAIKLQSALHSSSLTQETRALNAIISRVFLALYRTSDLENTIRRKIEKKMSRVSKPSFITALTLNAIDLGDAAPIFSNFRLKDMNISGDTTIALDVKYNGGLKIVVSAQAKIDLGSRFKTRTVDLVLASSLQRLQGHMLLRIKPPPSNRFWFCFEGAPEMDIKIEPIVSQRQITYTFILRAIEERIRSVVTETLVKPNWDDTPFFNTSSQYLRGGIWKDEKLETAAEEDETAVPTNSDSAEVRKRSSVLTSDSTSEDHPRQSDSISRAATLASSLAWQGSEHVKRRSVASLPAQSDKSSSTGADTLSIPRGLRSPSLTSPTPSLPSVSTEGATMISSKSHNSAPQPKGWRIRPGQQMPSKRDAVEAVREMRDRAFMHLNHEQVTGAATTSAAEEHEGDDNAMSAEVSLHSDSPSELSTSAPREDTLGGKDLPIRSNTNISSTSLQSRAQLQRKSILAATAAATNAARNWSWNQIANRGRNGSITTESTVSAVVKGEPIGRGQPLPPPGVPLPGPQKSLWASAGLSTIKRKPAPPLPPRSGHIRRPSTATLASQDEDGVTSDMGFVGHPSHAPQDTGAEDEFGPWSENSGVMQGDANEVRKVPEEKMANTSEDHLSATTTNFTTSEHNSIEDLDFPSGTTQDLVGDHDIDSDMSILPSDHSEQPGLTSKTIDTTFATGKTANEGATEPNLERHGGNVTNMESQTEIKRRKHEAAETELSHIVDLSSEHGSTSDGKTAAMPSLQVEEEDVPVQITDVVNDDHDE